LFGTLFKEDSGDFRGRRGEGTFLVMWQASKGFLEAHPGTTIPPPRIPDLYGWCLEANEVVILTFDPESTYLSTYVDF